MKKRIFQILAIVLLNCGFLSLGLAETSIVQIETSSGNITLELYPEDAPLTVENFLGYVNDDFYEGTLFHRVIEGFMIQGGGFDQDFVAKQTKDSISNEANNGLKNLRGTIAMARTSDPHSATAQFFINHTDNGFLDFTGETPTGWGYAVFGKVIDGLPVLDEIATTATTNKTIQPFPNPLQDVPVENVVIQKLRLISESSDAVYHIGTATLELPVVLIGDQVFSVTMVHSGDGVFDISRLDPLLATFDFSKATYDAPNNLLRVTRVQVGDELYDAELSYLGNRQLKLMDVKRSE